MKQDFKDPSNLLASWNIDDGEFCKWASVVCNNFTGLVTELNLGNPFNYLIPVTEIHAHYNLQDVKTGR